jgi:hypothetical protein
MSQNLFQASHQWATRPEDQRFESLAQLRDSVSGRRLRSRSVDLDIGRIEVSETVNGIAVNSAITACEPSHWAFGQLAAMVKAPANYLRQLPRPLLVQCLNDGIKKTGRETVKFMTVTEPDADINTLQAVTSPTYGRIWDADCVDAVSRIVERSGGKFHNPLAYRNGGQRPSGLYASDRDVFIFMIDGGSRLEVGPRAKLNRGFFVKNSEVGAATFSLTTFLFNEVCGNHIVWGAQDVRELTIRHTKNGPYRFDSEAFPALKAYAESSAATEQNAVKKAMEYILPVKDDELSALVAPFKFSKAELREAVVFAKAEEGQCATLWDLVQGFTAYARGFDWVDARVDLETRAGKLLGLVS